MSDALPPFQSVLDAHGREVLRYLRATAGPEADDCWQETCVAALRAYRRLDDARNLRGWLLTIAHRKALDAHRARARRPVPVGAAPARDDEAVAAPGEPADGELWARVAALPPRQRAAVVLRFACDLSYAEVADVAGGTESAARRNTFEGLRRLRDRWPGERDGRREAGPEATDAPAERSDIR